MLTRNIYFFPSLPVLALLASCSQQPEKMFTPLPASSTNIKFENNLLEKSGLGILNYIYYYNGGGVAVGDINNDGLPDIYFTANSKGNNKLYLNKGNFKFEDVTASAGLAGSSDWCTGVTMADVNEDGLLDIYVCAIAGTHQLQGRNRLFINQGDVKFTESAAAYGLGFSGLSTQAAFFDYDHDGDLDCYILNQSEHPNQNIVDTSRRRKYDAASGDLLYRNDLVNGRRKFIDVSAEAGIYQSDLGYGLGIAIADLNNDGWDDIYIGNDFHENDYYYVNDGNGKFTESGAGHFKHYSRYSMGNDIADFNNDGQPDIITVDMLPGNEKELKTYGNGEHLDVYDQKILRNGYQNQYSKNCLQRNNGNGESFSDVGLISGVAATDWSWSPLFADFDNDGNKDLLISSGIVKRPLDLDFIMFFSNIKDPRQFGSPALYEKALIDKMPGGESHPFLFKGDGHLNFKDSSDNWGTGSLKGFFNGAAYADLDNDGNLDIVINCLNAPAVILKNNAPRKNFISVSFKGDSLNGMGIGAKAYLFTGVKMQYQQLMLTRGFMSSVEPRLHFGLDSLRSADSILIVWPDQKYQLLKNVPSGKPLIVKQIDAKGNFVYLQFFRSKKPAWQDISQQVNASWVHRENNFTDFNFQYLVPHLESTRGPKLAVTDINKDGLDDLFICGASGQPGCLMIQTKDGQFLKTDSSIFNKNILSEGVDAIFFDANNDGYPDLYVVSGGNEFEDGNTNLADHLYINDGKRHFVEADNSIPAILTNKSCVSVADINHDGNNDLFVGGLAATKKYGCTKASSYLLMGNGRGYFTKAGDGVIPLKETGIITSAVFADFNNDGWPDLALAGEWMGVKIFLNNKGIFKQGEISHSNGLWQSLFATDINGDGNIDILAGNWGTNSKLVAGKHGPLKLYVKDFDHNGEIESMVTYSIAGNEYSFLGKDQLEQAVPSLKKEHLTYDDVAGKSVQYLFGKMFTDPPPIQLTAETLASARFMNDGKGSFTRTNLPDDLQLSPIFTFAKLPESSSTAYLAAGNFYGVFPYEGRYDAMLPSFFSYNNKTADINMLGELPAIDGEIRDAKWIRYSNGGKVLVLAKNNSSLVFLKAFN